jgi:two-component system, NarL family, nitrate/nitrite response regulator NarL
VRVLVVTDIRLYREGVADVLRRVPDVDAAHTAASGAAAVVAARREEHDVVLLDMTLPDSVKTARSLLLARPALKVVALGVPEDGPEVVRAAETGVVGYVSREATLEDVGEALRCAVRGEATVSATVAAGLLHHIALQARSRSVASTPHQLTRREHEVLHLLESGLTNKEIARALDLRLSTVKNHVHHVLTKYGVARRADVVRAASTRG